MRGNIIQAVFKTGENTAETKAVFQWDYGQILKMSGIELPLSYSVYFANRPRCGDADLQVGDADGVSIPDKYLATGLPVYAWVFLHSALSDGETVYMVTIPVIRRPRRCEDEVTPAQESVIDQAIAALNMAVEAAETAQGKAETAQTAAETAQTAAETAQGKAETAQTAAETAQGKAETAQTAAETAQTAAETAQGKAETAQTAAETAQGKAETAQGKAEDAQSAAETAQGKAETAQTAAETAQTAAETAQGKAETAQTAAETAQGKAETAQGKAETAQTAAETAQGKAETAQGKAEDAQSAAETAQGLAEAAKRASDTNASNAATSANNAADSKNAAAQTLLAVQAVVEGIAQENTAESILAIAQQELAALQRIVELKERIRFYDELPEEGTEGYTYITPDGIFHYTNGEYIKVSGGDSLNGFALSFDSANRVVLSYVNPEDETDVGEATLPADSTGAEIIRTLQGINASLYRLAGNTDNSEG